MMPVTLKENTTIGSSMLELYANHLWTDVKLRCKDHDQNESISAHKIVLAARSPVFRAMFFGPCADGKTEVQLDCVEAQTLDLFLRFIYSDMVNLSVDIAPNLLEMAHYYQVTTLVKLCADYLGSNITCENVCELLTLAQRYELTAFRETCCTFIDKNALSVLKTESFLELSQECLEYVLKGDTFYADEVEIFARVEEWAKKKLKKDSIEECGSNVRKALGESFYHLRLPTMTSQNMMDCTRRKGYFSMEEHEDMVDFMNKKPDTKVRSNSCVGRLPSEETLIIDDENDLESIVDHISSRFKISVSRDVELIEMNLAEIHKYLKYEDTFYGARNCDNNLVYGIDKEKLFSKYGGKVIKLGHLGLWDETVGILNKLEGKDLPDELRIVISGSIKISCREVNLTDSVVGTDELETVQKDSEEIQTADGRRLDDTERNEHGKADHNDNEEECMIFEQEFELISTDAMHRLIHFKEPPVLTPDGSPYIVSVNLNFCCKSDVKIKTRCSSVNRITSRYRYVEVEDTHNEFAGIKSLKFRILSNRDITKTSS